MNFSFFIARRYLVSKKSHNAINIISFISISLVTTATAALIIILSVFNGFDDLIQKFLKSYDPDLKITSRTGKVFDGSHKNFESVKNLSEVAVYAEILEDNVLLTCQNRQKTAVLKGVPESYKQVTALEKSIVRGVYSTVRTAGNNAVFGAGIAYYLGISMPDQDRVDVWIPNRNAKNANDPEQAFNVISINPSGIVSIDPEFDAQFVITDIAVVRDIADRSNSEVSSVEIKLIPNSQTEEIKQKIKKILGKEFDVNDRYEQHELLFKIMKTEKKAVFFILLFIIIIASFSITASLTMLILEKKHDIVTLKNMGATQGKIKRIFVLEGWLISIFGAFFGLIIGIATVFAQQQFSIITFPQSGNFIIDAYPVLLKIDDTLLTFVSVSITGLIISTIPLPIINKLSLN